MNSKAKLIRSLVVSFSIGLLGTLSVVRAVTNNTTNNNNNNNNNNNQGGCCGGQ